MQYFTIINNLRAYQVQRRVFTDGWNATTCEESESATNAEWSKPLWQEVMGLHLK